MKNEKLTREEKLNHAIGKIAEALGDAMVRGSEYSLSAAVMKLDHCLLIGLTREEMLERIRDATRAYLPEARRKLGREQPVAKLDEMDMLAGEIVDACVRGESPDLVQGALRLCELEARGFASDQLLDRMEGAFLRRGYGREIAELPNIIRETKAALASIMQSNE